MAEVRPSFLTPGTAEWNELTGRYVAESARTMLRELARLPRLLKELRQRYKTEQEWQEYWREIGVDGDVVVRHAAVYQEQLTTEDKRLRDRELALQRQVEEARAEAERVRLRRAEIQHDLAQDEQAKREATIVSAVASNTQDTNTQRQRNGKRARGTAIRDLLLYFKAAPDGVSAQHAARELKMSTKYCYKQAERGFLYKRDQLFFISELGVAELESTGSEGG